MTTVRFEPHLSEAGQAFNGVPFLIPISIEQLGSTTPPTISDLSVEASFDDGASWHQVPVHRDDKEWLALVTHPKQNTYVSLRAVARDAAGNTVEQTISRAYSLIDKPI
jgi:hypothetical protein